MGDPTGFDAARFKAERKRNWDAGADGWRRWSTAYAVVSRGATAAILKAVAVRPGMQVLDVASGSGEPALTLAEAVGPTGKVTATDLSPEMLVVAAENAAVRGRNNLIFQEADAENLPFLPDSFDRVTCSFGIMFCPDPARALGEICRVLRPGGKAAFVAWGPPAENPQFTSTIGILRQYISPSPASSSVPTPPGVPTPYTYALPGTLSTALSAAGFVGIEEETQVVPWTFPGTAAAFWEFTRDMAGLEPMLDSLTPEQRSQAICEILAALGEYEEDGQLNLTATIVLGVGTKAR